MKIAHLTTVDMSLRYLVLPQLEAGLRFGESIGISAPGEYVDELEARGIRHIPLHSSTRGMSLVSDLRAALELRRALVAERIDILHTHNPKPGLYGRVVGRLSGVPIVVNTVHGLYATEDSSLLKRAIVYGAEFVASRFSDLELIQSPEDFELMRRLHLTPRRRTRLLGNGVDLTRFNPESVGEHRETVRAELGVDPDEILVGMVGRLVAEKGVGELIEAALAMDDGFVFAIAGPFDPDKDDALSRTTIRRAEEAGILFLGMRRDVERLYGAFDIFVLPSHREGFPRAAMEAAASGLPVVATDIRGCRQVVEDGRNGFLFPVRDPDALRERVQRLGEDAELRKAMAGESAAKARQEFDERRVVERVLEAYEEAAREKGLSWELMTETRSPVIAPASVDDAPAVARLHQTMISSGFLSTLGPRFLSVLYRAMIRDERSTVLVARDDDVVVGFVAGTEDTSRLYRRVLSSELFPLIASLVPKIFRPSMWRRIVETLRYGGGGSSAGAELLSLAVAPVARRRGLGRELVGGLLDEARQSGLETMKVVVGADNKAAIALYQDCGFLDGRQIEVHADSPSWELIWSG